MGGAVSSGRDNNELVDNLMSGNYIRTRTVERVFRALDRADYMSAEARDQAYKDLAWRNGPLHLSAPCIYSEVMEALELKPGLSFLNIGSGTGYLSTLVGLIIGSTGISHGVEASAAVYEYANKKLSQFMENSATIDEFDFCIPKYYTGNGLCLSPSTYDRVYCGAGVVAQYENYFKQFIKLKSRAMVLKDKGIMLSLQFKPSDRNMEQLRATTEEKRQVGGVLVMPLADQLVQLRRVSPTSWARRNLLNVSFAHLSEPAPQHATHLLTLEEQCPPPLQILSRATIRTAMRAGVMRRDAELREPPPQPPPHPKQGPRRICIPYDDTSDEEVSDAEWEDLMHFAEELNSLHDLDEAGGAREMNALLSLVLSMGQNRAAGSLRFEHDDQHADRRQEAVEERERNPDEAPAAADDDFIVFDVGVRAATRRRVRAPRPAPAAEGEPAPAPEDASAPPDDSAPTDDPPAESSSGESRTAGEAAPPRAPPRHRAPPRRSDRPRTFWTDLSSSEDDTAQTKDNKRQKLDSGIGEGTASSGASPDKSDDKTAASRSTDNDEDDEGAGDTDMPWAERDSGSGSTDGSESEGERSVAWRSFRGDCGPGARHKLPLRRLRCTRIATGVARRRAARPRGPPSETDSGAEEAGARRDLGVRRDPAGARRVRLSLAMKRAVKELPLPQALKKYINYGRCYQI